MNTKQSYVGGGNNDQHSEQTVQKNDQSTAQSTHSNFARGLKDDPGALSTSPIPDYVLDTCPYLKESIRILDDPDQRIEPIYALNAIYLAYELGQKMATPDEPTLPTVNLSLAAVTDIEQQQNGQRSELQVVEDALARYMQLPNTICSEGERQMLHYMLEGLRSDTSDLIARLYSQTITGTRK